MYLEVVKFGNGIAIEIRDTPTRITVLYMFVCALNSSEVLSQEEMPHPPQLSEMDAFEDQCVRNMSKIDEKLRWIMLCTDVEMLTESYSKEFDETFTKAFQVKCSNEVPDDRQREECMLELGIKTKQRVWMFDRETGRMFAVHFQFAKPIYGTTLLAGVMLNHKTFEAQYSIFETQNTPTVIKKDDTTQAQRMLTRLRELMPKQLADDADTGILESREVNVTEFIIKDAKMWCGEKCFKGVWIAQQLNVWFNTPTSEQCWFRPSDEDAFSFTVGILDEMTTPDTTHDAERWLALPAPSAKNNMWRYPNHSIVCGTPQGMLGVGHFLPQFDENLQRWTDTHQFQDVRMFRLYKTQYPYVYSLMPNDDCKVRELKLKLKRSTESNPSLGGRLKTRPEQSGSTPRFNPLIATIPTLELERYVKAVFQQTPKHRYRRWWCVNINNNTWVPISPTE